jgi:hypothetical protein
VNKGPGLLSQTVTFDIKDPKNFQKWGPKDYTLNENVWLLFSFNIYHFILAWPFVVKDNILFHKIVCITQEKFV